MLTRVTLVYLACWLHIKEGKVTFIGLQQYGLSLTKVLTNLVRNVYEKVYPFAHDMDYQGNIPS